MDINWIVNTDMNWILTWFNMDHVDNSYSILIEIGNWQDRYEYGYKLDS